MDVTVTITVNGVVRRVTADPGRSLLDVLREDLRGTGSWHRCGQGRCGGCVVLLDDRRVLACDTSVIEAHRRTVTTIDRPPSRFPP